MHRQHTPDLSIPPTRAERHLQAGLDYLCAILVGALLIRHHVNQGAPPWPGLLLIVTAGLGRAQSWGGPILEIRPGDVVWFPAEERHWHGAAPDAAMTHIAVHAALDGRTVDWDGPVADHDYLAEPERSGG